MVNQFKQADESGDGESMRLYANARDSERIPYSAPVLSELSNLRDITLGGSPVGNESGGGGLYDVIEPFSSGFDEESTTSRTESKSSSDSRGR